MTPAGTESATFRFIAQHLNHCATAVPHIYSFNDLKFTLKHLKRSYMFRSYDHPQGAYIVAY